MVAVITVLQDLASGFQMLFALLAPIALVSWGKKEELVQMVHSCRGISEQREHTSKRFPRFQSEVQHPALTAVRA